MKVCTIIVVVFAALWMGCSGHDGWYDEQRSHSRERDAFVEMQRDAGISELDAKRAWDSQQMIENTRALSGSSRRGVTLDADEFDY